jgi:hypothetical protein
MSVLEGLEEILHSFARRNCAFTNTFKAELSMEGMRGAIRR